MQAVVDETGIPVREVGEEVNLSKVRPTRDYLGEREQETERSCVPEGMTGIEPASPAWKAGIIATI